MVGCPAAVACSESCFLQAVEVRPKCPMVNKARREGRNYPIGGERVSRRRRGRLRTLASVWYR